MKTVLLLYVPVLHQGYLQLFAKYVHDVDALYILGADLVEEHTYLTKEIRAMNPPVVRTLVESLGLFKRISVLGKDTLKDFRPDKIVTTKEGIMTRIMETYFPDKDVVYDTVFLRWDETHVDTKKPVIYDRVSTDEVDLKLDDWAQEEGKKTSDWWRSVGAVAERNSVILFCGHNRHTPSEHAPYAFGDIRDFIPAGENSDISSALHAEKDIITQAARRVLKGASIHLTTFPCPDCARMIAHSGIKRVYFSGGHASFNGERELRAQGVELIYVKR